MERLGVMEDTAVPFSNTPPLLQPQETADFIDQGNVIAGTALAYELGGNSMAQYGVIGWAHLTCSRLE